jgi:hypothetical protein
MVAWNPWTDLREREDVAALNVSFPFGPMPGEVLTFSIKRKKSVRVMKNMIVTHINCHNCLCSSRHSEEGFRLRYLRKKY